jgi:hypothetical protein
MKQIAVALLLMMGLFAGCEKKSDILINESDQLTGYWSNPVLEDTIWKYERVSELQANEYSFAFKPDQTFVERKNAGWCGTPPISYANYDGTWSRTGSEIKIKVAFWGGTADFQWMIVSVDNKFLKVYRGKEDYKMENRN